MLWWRGRSGVPGRRGPRGGGRRRGAAGGPGGGRGGVEGLQPCARVAGSSRRDGEKRSTGWRVPPSMARSARISPITLQNLYPCPGKPAATAPRGGAGGGEEE